MCRNHQSPAARELNPMRELAAEQQRSAEGAHARVHTQKLKSEFPTLIDDHVGEEIEKLESRLLNDFRKLGKKAVEESTAVLNQQLSERITTLEQVSSIQSRTITNLRDSSKVADQKVSSVVNTMEKTLSDAADTERVKTESVEIDVPKSRYGFCPNCTSTNIRRAYRHGMFEEFLRLFFIAPFRCRACRHKFYRF